MLPQATGGNTQPWTFAAWVPFTARQAQFPHSTQRHPQHCQPLVDARFHTGPRLQCQRCERSPSENSTSLFLPEEPSNPQLSAPSTTQSFKTGPWLPPAAFSSLLTFAELLLCTLILQPLPFLPHHYQFFFSSALHRLFHCASSLDCWKSGTPRMQHQLQAPLMSWPPHHSQQTAPGAPRHKGVADTTSPRRG